MKKYFYYRKLIHLFLVVIVIIYLTIIKDKSQFLLLMSILTIGSIIFDINRLRIPWIQSVFSMWFNPLLKKHELKGKLTGASWILIGSLVTVFLFPRDVAILALLFVSIGDVTAAFVGKSIGRIKLFNKTLEGFLSGLFVCFIIAIFFPDVSWTVKTVGVFSSMVVEVLPMPLDDNFRIPVISGFLMTITQFFLP